MQKTITGRIKSHTIRNHEVKIRWDYNRGHQVSVFIYKQDKKRKSPIAKIKQDKIKKTIFAVIHCRRGKTTKELEFANIKDAIRISIDEYFLGKQSNEEDYLEISYVSN